MNCYLLYFNNICDKESNNRLYIQGSRTKTAKTNPMANELVDLHSVVESDKRILVIAPKNERNIASFPSHLGEIDECRVHSANKDH